MTIQRPRLQRAEPDLATAAAPTSSDHAAAVRTQERQRPAAAAASAGVAAAGVCAHSAAFLAPARRARGRGAARRLGAIFGMFSATMLVVARVGDVEPAARAASNATRVGAPNAVAPFVADVADDAVGTDRADAAVVVVGDEDRHACRRGSCDDARCPPGRPAAPASPARRRRSSPSAPLPATVVMMRVLASTLRTRLWCMSAM